MQIALPADFRELLGGLAPDLVEDPGVGWYGTLDEALEAVRGAEAMWYHVDPAAAARILAAGPGLRWLSTVGAGMDRWPLDVLRERALLVTNGAGLAALPIAEYTVAFMLAAGRGLEAIVNANRRRVWDAKVAGDRELNGTRALIVGYGNIGQAIARRLEPFGVTVVGSRRRPDGATGVLGASEWRSRLGEFDWLILANPLTSETRHQLGEREIAAMKRGAWVVNIARGELIDDEALLTALRDGHVGGAILDTFSTEPLPSEHPYWSLPNVFVTPHISWKSTRFRERAAALFLANLDRFRRGEKLENVVDLDAGY